MSTTSAPVEKQFVGTLAGLTVQEYRFETVSGPVHMVELLDANGFTLAHTDFLRGTGGQSYDAQFNAAIARLVAGASAVIARRCWQPN